MADRLCRGCGIAFMATAPANVYCTDDCRRLAANARRRATRRAIPHCRYCRNAATIEYEGVGWFCGMGHAIDWLKRRYAGKGPGRLPPEVKRMLLVLHANRAARIASPGRQVLVSAPPTTLSI